MKSEKMDYLLHPRPKDASWFLNRAEEHSDSSDQSRGGRRESQLCVAIVSPGMKWFSHRIRRRMSLREVDARHHLTPSKRTRICNTKRRGERSCQKRTAEVRTET